MKWLAVLLAIGLVLVVNGMARPESTSKKAETNTHTARVGDLQVTVTTAGAVASSFARQHGITPRTGSHFVVVNLKFKNLASYSSCCALEAWVRVDLGFNYSQYNARDLKGPKTYDLEPREESEGSYVFEVKDGTHPVALKLIHNTMDEDFCAHSQHRRLNRFTQQKDVILSLRSLPEPAN